jgi:hypothetical protein
MTARLALPVLALLLGLSTACGGGGGNSAGTQAASPPTHAASPPSTSTTQTGEELCVAGLMGLATMMGYDPTQFAQTFCDYGDYAGRYEEDDTEWAILAPKLSTDAYLHLIDHNCVDFANHYFDQFPKSLREDLDVEINSAEWGRQFCRGYFDDQYFSEDRTVPASGFAQYFKDHISLITPFMVAGAMRSYRADLTISREQFRKLVERVVDDAVKKGIISPASDPPYIKVDQKRFQALIEDAAKQYQ